MCTFSCKRGLAVKYVGGLSIICIALAAPFAFGENWPFWRGPTNDGVCQEKNLPFQWSETKNIAWKLPLPPGKAGSTPVIWNDKIFLPVVDGKDIALWCVGTDGTVRWRTRLGASGRIKVNSSETNDASNSASTDGKHVYIFDGAGDFVCLDFDGNEVWRFNTIERYGPFKSNWGLHTTPLLHGDRLYLTLLHYLGQWIVAIDKATGKEVWKAARQTDAKGENTNSYTCPLIWQNAKEPCLVVAGCDYITGHKINSGEELWRLHIDAKGNTNIRVISSPVATPELLVAGNWRGDGPLFAIKPGGKGTLLPDGPFIQWHLPRAAPDVSSPLIHDGLVYLCKAEICLLTCVDLATGKELYKERLRGSKYRASPVYADGKVYVTAHDGSVSVIKAGPKFELLAENTLEDNFSASPAISNGRIYLRGWGAHPHLYAIESAKK
jgi:outer membrane protein assembly factor BamB